LLELLAYHPDISIQANDTILDVIDYISVKFNYLITSSSEAIPKSAKEMIEKSDEKVPTMLTQRFDQTIEDMDFAVAISTIALFRYITDSIAKLPLSAIASILNIKDMICVLVVLLEKSPWIRKSGDSLTRFENGSWQPITEDDLQTVTKVEAQIWLALMNLLLDPECRKAYHYTERNHQIVLRVLAANFSSKITLLSLLLTKYHHWSTCNAI
jgi:zinc finger MYND domain-containing protein 10